MAFTVDGDDLVARFDFELLGRMVNDDQSNPLTKAQVIAHADIDVAIQDAIGRFVAAVQSGKRYETADLDSLTSVSLEYAKKIVCSLAAVNLMGRRPGTHTLERDLMLKEINGYLDALAGGKDVFTLEDHVDAGLAQMHNTDESIRVRRSLIADRLRGHLVTFEQDV